MDSQPVSSSTLRPPLGELVAAGIVTTLLVCGGGILLDLPPLFYSWGFFVALVCGYPILHYWPNGRAFGAANRVTLARGVLVVLLVGLAPWAGELQAWLWPYGVLSLVALLLDGVDGTVARKTDTRTEFGARFDMELDALFILGLCVAVIALGKAGPWAIAVGLMRYLFVGAGAIWPWINRPLPESFRRKTICVWQLVTLMVAILPVTSPDFASWTLATALALLGYSFTVDLLYLFQTRRTP